ncbi:hypothetical protein LVR30_20195 [Pantoea ananatis]|uniref:site-specific integrase n=1 Tax=Pantoea ananas TaxID=553 RepID=UPI002025EF26|nr:site-specific integrase [Pantoea ananatis]URL14483.1 hypothetical protein LVR30_20195 [Pantoea ananatis]
MKQPIQEIIQPSMLTVKTSGYPINVVSDIWVLDRNHSLNMLSARNELEPPILNGFIKTLIYYVQHHSPSYTQNIFFTFIQFIRLTSINSSVTPVSLLAFKARYADQIEQLHRLKAFILKWFSLGYEAVSEDCVKVVKQWQLNGIRRKGERVKRMDHKEGPLTDLELQIFNDAVIRSGEKGDITWSEMVMSLLICHTGRRPLQICSLKVRDIMKVREEDGNPLYLINIPRIKQKQGFRKSFRTFRITRELHEMVCSQAKDSVRVVTEAVGTLTQELIKDIPLFPDLAQVASNGHRDDLTEILRSDRLHFYSDKPTSILKKIARHQDLQSENAVEPLNVNSIRFRYTLGTRAAREGHGERIIAEILDHSDTASASIYVQNHPDILRNIEKALGEDITRISALFTGNIIDEKDDNEIVVATRIKNQEGSDTGNCVCSSCTAEVPFPCYTCQFFHPWLHAPHEKVYRYLLAERIRIFDLTSDARTAETLDRTIIAVAQVMEQCKKMKSASASQEKTHE